MVWLCAVCAAGAETLRIATYHTELSRKGPGLLLRDLLKGEDEQAAAIARIVARVAPDVLILQGVDYDHGLVALTALRDLLAVEGPDYPYIIALLPNTGMATGLDVDGDGRFGEPEDAQGFGRFAGQGGMAILSMHPILASEAQDFSAVLWKDLPGAIPPDEMAEDVRNGLRLSATGHWAVPLQLETGLLQLLTFHAAPPVFDGPEDRNGRRNHDEITFWRHMLDGRFGEAPQGRFVLAGVANLDPVDGEGRKAAILDLLADSRLQDPEPRRNGPAQQGDGQKGEPALDTVAWPGPEPGHLRVSYVLPSADLDVVAAGVHWPAEADEMASRHRMVWVDVRID